MVSRGTGYDLNIAAPQNKSAPSDVFG